MLPVCPVLCFVFLSVNCYYECLVKSRLLLVLLFCMLSSLVFFDHHVLLLHCYYCNCSSCCYYCNLDCYYHCYPASSSSFSSFFPRVILVLILLDALLCQVRFTFWCPAVGASVQFLMLRAQMGSCSRCLVQFVQETGSLGCRNRCCDVTWEYGNEAESKTPALKVTWRTLLQREESQ